LAVRARNARSPPHARQVLNWQQDEAVAFYSRLREEFGAGKWITYLLKDSLACTTAAKHKLHSRAAAYKRVGHTLGGYPMPSELRPFRFRAEQPVPRWACGRPGGCPVGECEDDARDGDARAPAGDGGGNRRQRRRADDDELSWPDIVKQLAEDAAAGGDGGALLGSGGDEARPASPLDDLSWLRPPVTPTPFDSGGGK
jgi:hypothetical protein